MERIEAIKWLRDRGELYSPFEEREFTKEEESKIQETMKKTKKGKIFGDPLVILNE